MADPRSRRKLAAILSADVVGYSRLMAANEAATVETLKAYRDIIARLVVRHDGAWSTHQAMRCWPSS
jgi:class 3 adenylate cyclase